MSQAHHKKTQVLSYFLKKGNNNFDLLRLLAAIMVIYAHSFPLAYSEGYKDVILSLSKGLSDGGALAVKFFFFLSGLLVTNSLLNNPDIKRFVIARFFRIYPAFIFVVLFGALVIGPWVTTLSSTDYFNHEGTWAYIWHTIRLKIAFFLPGVFEDNIYQNSVNGSLWTIPFEIAAYTLLLASYIFTLFSKNQTRILTLCLLAIIILPVFNIGNGLFFDKDNLSTSLLAPCFALGALFTLHKDEIEVSLKYPLAFLAVSYLTHDLYLKHMMFFFFCSTAFLYLGTTKTFQKIKIEHDISYGVYLWGFLVQQTVFHLMPNLHLFVNQIFCIAISIALAIPTFILLEKPAINLGRKLANK
ncbi:hypothetical protein B0181_04740 [Moraxella caviae]|uniref:Acyltransferase family n=1 Tax=Moraxella caviae TaxID=34060 RepID=A0A1T0A359_9GAMM|nr:acyltransferase [Moraxella caviae]OOR90186.1 hypothetical protein B0181_04740 [Moraxella caviae]STZ14597.1 Acyltransferase family [Moraxella caviae]VEW11366.1 Acyltransferase family [Moraxella caviae]